MASRPLGRPASEDGVAANNILGGWVDTEYKLTFTYFNLLLLYLSTIVKYFGELKPAEILLVFSKLCDNQKLGSSSLETRSFWFESAKVVEIGRFFVVLLRE